MSGPGHVRVAAALVWNQGRVLLTQRPEGGSLGLMWEFPGGKIERGESVQHALVREIREELGVEATPRETIAVHTHDYAHGLRVEVTFVRCELDSHEFLPSRAVRTVRWAKPEEVDLEDLLEADRPFLDRLRRES